MYNCRKMKASIWFLLVILSYCQAILLDTKADKDSTAPKNYKWFPGLKSDIAIVMDCSDNIGQYFFNLQKQFLTEFISHLVIGIDNVQVAVDCFTSTVYPEIKFGQYNDTSALAAAIHNITLKGGQSTVDSAVRFAIDKTFQTISGSRSNAKHLMIVITGSQPTMQQSVELRQIQENTGIKSIVIGAGCRLSHTVLDHIASDKTFVVTLNGSTTALVFWRDLQNKIRIMIRNAVHTPIMYPYGKFNGDTEFTSSSTVLINFTTPLKILGIDFYNFSVNLFGVISLNKQFPYSMRYPELFPTSYGDIIAPLWTKMYHGKVTYRQTIDPTLLRIISSDVSQFLRKQNNITSFKATWALLATWVNSYYYSGDEISFQAVITSDGNRTFAIFNYEKIYLQYDYYSGEVGFNIRSQNGFRYYSLKGSHSRLYNQLNASSNTGVIGRWIYRIDEETVQDNGAELKAPSVSNTKNDLQIFSPLCVFHHNPNYTFCNCPHGKSGDNCDINVSTCFESFKKFSNTFVRCGYDQDDGEERCFLQCSSGYYPAPGISLNGAFFCSTCNTRDFLSRSGDICVPSSNGVFG